MIITTSEANIEEVIELVAVYKFYVFKFALLLYVCDDLLFLWCLWKESLETDVSAIDWEANVVIDGQLDLVLDNYLEILDQYSAAYTDFEEDFTTDLANALNIDSSNIQIQSIEESIESRRFLDETEVIKVMFSIQMPEQELSSAGYISGESLSSELENYVVDAFPEIVGFEAQTYLVIQIKNIPSSLFASSIEYLDQYGLDVQTHTGKICMAVIQLYKCDLILR